MLQVRYNLEVGDVLALHALRRATLAQGLKPAWGAWRLGASLWVVLISIAFLVQLVLPGDWGTKVVWMMVVGVGSAVLLVLLVMLMPKLVSTRSAEQGMIQAMFAKGEFGTPGAEVTVTLREDGILSATAAAETLARWSHVETIAQSPEVIAVAWGTGASIVVPTRAFASAQEVQAFVGEAQRRKDLARAPRTG